MESQFIKDAIIRQAMAQGLDAIGFCEPSIRRQARQRFIELLRQGYHGDMGWLKARLRKRLNPRQLWSKTRSVIVVGISYRPQHDPLEIIKHKNKGAVSVYARMDDYHHMCKQVLQPLTAWMERRFSCHAKICVDSAAVMEKPLAQQAGLGWQGKHSNLVSRDYGSWLFLAEILTDLHLPHDVMGHDHCGSCRACLDVCPTRAFPAPYRLDARRCISYLTIEHKGVIDRALRPLMGNRIFGCDDCLAVCPWNKFARAPSSQQWLPHGDEQLPGLRDYVSLDEEGFRRMFAGTAVRRIGRNRFVRNVLIALGNSGASRDGAVIASLLHDSSPLVRGMAVWALAQLMPQEWMAEQAAQHLPQETDAHVREEWQVVLDSALNPALNSASNPSPRGV